MLAHLCSIVVVNGIENLMENKIDDGLSAMIGKLCTVDLLIIFHDSVCVGQFAKITRSRIVRSFVQLSFR